MSSGAGTAVGTEPVLRWVQTDALAPNDWNPNAMDAFMYDKALASISEFGFVDPITCRTLASGWEIIDGEHRWRAARQMNLATVPIFDLGVVPDDAAAQLTIVLNETRGSVDPRKLGALLRDLASRNSKEKLLATLPFSREAFERLSGTPSLDLSSIGQPQPRLTGERPSPWVERVYRMPSEAAEVIDRAIERVRYDADDERTPEWKALELIAADYLGS